MTDPLQALFQTSSLGTTLFPPTSRYHGIAIARLDRPDGTAVVYLRRRFVPQPDRFVVLQEHGVVEGDRLDNLAASYLGDPGQFWRICDANAAMRPEELIEALGRRLRITLPEGIPGSTND
jgi:hypothetical protein